MKDTPLWSVTIPRVMSVYANAVFLALWVGFAVALVVNQDWLDVAWAWAQALPPIPTIIIWALLLPVMVGLWIWQASWPAPAWIIGLVAIVAWNALAVSSLFKAFGSSAPAHPESNQAGS